MPLREFYYRSPAALIYETLLMFVRSDVSVNFATIVDIKPLSRRYVLDKFYLLKSPDPRSG